MGGKTDVVQPSQDPVNNGFGNEWHLTLYGSLTKGTDVLVQPAPAVVVHHGNWFHYLCLTQNIHPIVFDRVNEKLAKRQRKIIEKEDDVNVTIRRYGNRILISASYDFINDEKDSKTRSAAMDWAAYEGTLGKRMRFPIEESIKMVSAILIEEEKASKDARKEMGEQALSYLSREDFVFLIDDGYEKLTVVEGPKEGRRNFSNSKTEAHYEIYNFGDRLVLSMYEEFPATTEAQRIEIVNKVNAQVSKKPAKGAQSMEALLHPEGDEYIWVKANFALTAT